MRGKLLASWASAAILMASPLLVMLPQPTNAQLAKSASQTEGQVRNAVLNQLIKNNRVPNEGFRIPKIVVVGNYAYVNWEQGENAGGYALAIKKQGAWQAIIHGDDWGGIKVLEQDGVPRAAAEKLLDRAMPDWRQWESQETVVAQNWATFCSVINIQTGQLALRFSPNGKSRAGLDNENTMVLLKQEGIWAYVRVIKGPNSRVDGLEGWVNSNYLSCYRESID
jgi:hypothetical protein